MLLDRRTFLVKERVAIVKLTDAYDIFDPESGQPIGVAREEPASWAKYLRLFVDKRLLPTVVNVYEGDPDATEPFLSIRKGPAFLRSRVEVFDARGMKFGQFDSKLLSIGGAFTVSDASGAQVAEVKGDWKGWNFRFLAAGGLEIGVVTKQWGGLGKELFTSADTYVISLTDEIGGHEATALLLAAGLAIDIVLKEPS